jgi:hypothetical protein
VKIFLADTGREQRRRVASAGEARGDATREDEAEIGIASAIPILQTFAPCLQAVDRAAEQIVMRGRTGGVDRTVPCARGNPTCRVRLVPHRPQLGVLANGGGQGVECLDQVRVCHQREGRAGEGVACGGWIEPFHDGRRVPERQLEEGLANGEVGRLQRA